MIWGNNLPGYFNAKTTWENVYIPATYPGTWLPTAYPGTRGKSARSCKGRQNVPGYRVKNPKTGMEVATNKTNGLKILHL